MWSGSLPEARRQEVIATLREVLPAPRTAAASGKAPLNVTATALEVADGLHDRSGFIWLDRPNHARLFLDPLVRLSVENGVATVEGPLKTVSINIQAFDLVDAALEAWSGPAHALLCGYLGYELGAELEDLPTPERQPGEVPDFVLGLYDSVFECSDTGWTLSGTDAWRGQNGLPCTIGHAEALLSGASRSSQPPNTTQPLSPGPLMSSLSREEFEHAVRNVVRRIFEGELFQVNICRRLEAPLPEASIWPAYVRLRAASPAAYGAFLRLAPGAALLSVSPELFLAVEKSEVRSHPIKGTRRRGTSAAEDEQLAAELLRSEKDAAELAMIVDVTRNDLGRVCTPGSVSVSFHRQLMSLPTVHHTYSEVKGRLKANGSGVRLLRACFPPASISGAPKIRAIELAALEEGRRRGPCMGSIGWISMDGCTEFSVAIRTAVAAAGSIWYLAGCGITARSDPAEEFDESRMKASAFLNALGLPDI